MKDTRKKLIYFRTRDCAACRGLFDELQAVCNGHPIELVEKYADDGGDGSRLATDLRVMSVPTLFLVEEIQGRRTPEKMKGKIEAFARR